MELIYDIGSNYWTSWVASLWLEKVSTLKLPYLQEAHWETMAPVSALDDTGLECEILSTDDHFYLLFRNKVLVFATYAHGVVRLQCAGDSHQEVQAEIARWFEVFPVAEAADSLPVKFWFLSTHGPRSISRLVKVPTWEEIMGNYPGRVHAPLAALQTAWRPAGSGQLLLWHGPAGTGKTFALRALVRSWSSWCAPHFITDPDNFFGHNLDYLMNCVVGEEETGPRPGEPAKPDKWRLLILEDAGELLVPDARERVGQGLSRLLNLVDGLLGQGLRILVLITTNEPLQKIHPAVARPGRCASRIEFSLFGTAEANEWLKVHGADGTAFTAQTTLAELYARLADKAPSTGKSEVSPGFAHSAL